MSAVLGMFKALPSRVFIIHFCMHPTFIGRAECGGLVSVTNLKGGFIV